MLHSIQLTLSQVLISNRLESMPKHALFVGLHHTFANLVPRTSPKSTGNSNPSTIVISLPTTRKSCPENPTVMPVLLRINLTRKLLILIQVTSVNRPLTPQHPT